MMVHIRHLREKIEEDPAKPQYIITMKWFDEQGMWLQVLDEKGQEVYSYNKPDSYPISYFASELMVLQTSEFDNGYSVFTGDYEGLNQTYGFWLSKNLGKITEGIKNISKRNYTPLSGKGFFCEVFDELNEMNDEINRSDELKKETERG